MSYLLRLSGAQRVWLAGTVCAMLALVSIGWVMEPNAGNGNARFLSVNLTIRQIASKLDTTGFALAKELKLPRTVDRDTPLAELGVEQSKLDEGTAHIASHQGRAFKYYLYAALTLFGLVWSFRLGRPDGSPNSERKTWYPRAPHLLSMFLALFMCGFALGKSPNPMEGVVKLFKGMVGLQPSMLAVILAFVFFVGLAIVGNKVVCGWACPFGAIQELLYSLPLLKQWKRKKVPFIISNLVRGGLFAMMLLLMFGFLRGDKGIVLYHFINPFNLYDFSFEPPTILLTVTVSLGLALATYRPYCQFVCPFGLVSWLAERVSLVRVQVDPSRCNACGACARACPLPSAQHKVEQKVFGADCYSCARCLNACPHDAIHYTSLVTRPTSTSVIDKR